MGGMAAQIPIAGDDDANERALGRVRDDKLREVGAGFDGTWVAHPALIPLARAVFDAGMPGQHQQHVHRDDVAVTRDELLRAPPGSVTRSGFDNNVEVCVRYLAAWLDGQGCVPIHWLMEDAATAEIARAQLWQWLHFSDGGHEPLHLADGTPIDFALFERALIGLPGRFSERMQMPGASRIDEAIALLDELTHRDILEDFLTLPAYDHID
jgi:malate synthase